jgi:hypothetical protein
LKKTHRIYNELGLQLRNMPGRYYGLDPNRWLIEDGISRELGVAAVELKRPTFRYDYDFSASRFDVQFDYILAQSIFSHAGRDVISISLESFKERLSKIGLVSRYIYPTASAWKC